jgi:DNA-binding SARP family transcriptional activator
LALSQHELDMARRDLAAAASAYTTIRENAVRADQQHEDRDAMAYEHAAELLATALGIVPDEQADTIPPPAPALEASR